ncbi:hypothetical protein [Heyndrickxia oleronia]|uniref:hypothetical protein n=1 Tax=Heyndrickxia oleronia TaxID=38875 RepID=UPI0037510A51
MKKFVDIIIKGFTNVLHFIVSGFQKLIDLLAKPIHYLWYFLDGIFYFVTVLFNIVVKIVMIFVALFQFVFALIVGFLRTIQDFLTPSFNTGQVHFPMESNRGFSVVLDVVGGTGLLTIVPYILLALVWGAFIMKMFALLGGNLTVKGGD